MDLKGVNIMIGKELVLRVIDFGLAQPELKLNLSGSSEIFSPLKYLIINITNHGNKKDKNYES